MIQIIAFLAIILTVAFVIKRYSKKITIKEMSLTAILLTIALLLTLFSINTFFLGGQVVIRFSQLALILLGASLGPIYATIAGLGFDILNLLIFPLGAPYIGFTLNNIWVGLFAALVFKFFKDKENKTVFKAMLFTVSLYATYIIVVLLLFISQKSLLQLVDELTFNAIKNIVFATILVLLIVAGIFLFVKRQKKTKIKLSKDLMMIIISATLVEFIVQGFFTPIWLYDLAKTPILISMQIRALKGGLMVFLNSFVGYAVYKVIIKRLVK